jgi:hypothetical protein
MHMSLYVYEITVKIAIVDIKTLNMTKRRPDARVRVVPEAAVRGCFR